MADLAENALYEQAIKIVREANKASASLVQRRLSIGYHQAALLIQRMEAEGIVEPPDNVGRRAVRHG